MNFCTRRPPTVSPTYRLPLESMAAAARCELARAGTDATHLAQVAAAPVEHHHAMVAVSIRDVHAAAFSRYGVRVWIHGNVRRTMQESAAEALGRRVPGANAV